jgi:hypothetical protein
VRYSSPTMNDKMSSVVNNTQGIVCFWEHWDWRGLSFKHGPRTAVARMPWWFNDRASSMGPPFWALPGSY